MEVHNTNIRIWIHDQDLAKLEKVVWEGMGHLLVKHTSAHAKIRKFLDSIPQLMNDIKKVHSAAVKGDVQVMATKEFRQQVSFLKKFVLDLCFYRRRHYLDISMIWEFVLKIKVHTFSLMKNPKTVDHLAN